jgi:hypothetical protein
MIRRSPMAGMTNYGGASLSDLVEQLTVWHRDAARTANILRDCLGQVGENQSRLDTPHDIAQFIRRTLAVVDRFVADFGRLVDELPKEVLPAHLELTDQMLAQRDASDRWCIEFKNRHIESGVRDGEMRTLLETVYQEARTFFVDTLDLSNVAWRLKTFVGVAQGRREVVEARPADGALPALHLKPNVFGVGVNLNYVIGWFRRKVLGWKR